MVHYVSGERVQDITFWKSELLNEIKSIETEIESLEVSNCVSTQNVVWSIVLPPTSWCLNFLGPVVQSIVNLTSSLIGQLVKCMSII